MVMVIDVVIAWLSMLPPIWDWRQAVGARPGHSAHRYSTTQREIHEENLPFMAFFAARMWYIPIGEVCTALISWFCLAGSNQLPLIVPCPPRGG